MADILKGATRSHAPLSQQQTLSVFNYLQELQAETSRNLQDLKQKFDVAEVANSADRREQFVMVGTLQNMQQEMAEASGNIKSLQQQLSDCMRHARRLQGESQSHADAFTQLREGQKVTNTNVHCLKTDLAKKAEDIKDLQNVVAEVQEVTIANMKISMDQLDMKVEQISDDTVMNTTSLREHKKILEDHQRFLKNEKELLSALTDKVAASIKKLDETSKLSNDVKNNLEMTNGVVMQLHQDQELADKNIRDLKADSRFLKASLEKTNDDLAGTGKNLHEAREDQLSTEANLGHTRDILMQAVERIKALQEDDIFCQKAIDRLGRNLESVQNVAHHTKEDLKVTNAFVLPNLGAESSVAATAVIGGAANMGYTSLHSTGKSTDSERWTGRTYRSGPTTPTRSPRARTKDIKWHTRNIGAVPDRNSWI